MYKVELKKQADKFLKKLDKQTQKRITKKFMDLEENPRLGKPLTANLSGL